MHKKLISILLMGLICSPVFAYNAKFAVNLPRSGGYIYWLSVIGQYGDTSQTSPVQLSSAKEIIDLTQINATPRQIFINILDTKSQNVAVRTVNFHDPNCVVAVYNQDFFRIRSVKVSVKNSRGNPAVVGMVVFTDSEGSIQRTMIDPDSNGTVVFHNVKFGNANVKVQFNNKLVGFKNVNLTVDHSGKTVEIPVTVSNDIPVAQPTDEAKGVQKLSQPVTSKPLNAGNSIQPVIARLKEYQFFLIGGLGIMILCFVGIRGIKGKRKRSASIPIPASLTEPLILQQNIERPDSETPVEINPNKMPVLEGVAGPVFGHTIKLTPEKITIGRHRDNSYRMPLDTSMSDFHAEIDFNGSEYVIKTVKGSKGIFVNKEPVDTHILKDGDKVQIGNSTFICEWK